MNFIIVSANMKLHTLYNNNYNCVAQLFELNTNMTRKDINSRKVDNLV